MTQLIVDAGLRDRLLNVAEPVELCDDVGRVLGRFTPELNAEPFKQETAVADFFGHVTFTWTKSAHRVRQAARRFSEQTDADS